MHIVIFVDYHDSLIGGVPASIRAQRQSLEKLGHEVTVVCPPPPKAFAAHPGTIIIPPVPLARPNNFPMALPSRRNERLIERKLAERPPIDVVHVQTNLGIGVMGARYAKRHKLPFVQTMHGRDDVFAEQTYALPYLTTLVAKWAHRYHISHTQEISKLAESKTARNAWAVMVNHAQAADLVIVPTHHFAQRFVEHGMTRPIEVVSNGLDDAIVDALPAKPHKAHHPLRIVWVSRVSAEKRPLESLEVIRDVKGCTMDIYGDGPLMQKASEVIAEYGLEDRVTLKGRIDQSKVAETMAKYDLLLYPSYGFDSQGIVLLEATAASLPIVYCDPDLAESVPYGGGVLTKTPAVIDMIKAVRTLQADPERLNHMSSIMNQHRKQVAQSHFTAKIVKLYKKLLA